ncbi:MAG: 3-oxoacid CoA-transferase [Chloroflexi bacterium]|nr:3-oxoacid CoA-transferase [Chloroflexota bacterium]
MKVVSFEKAVSYIHDGDTVLIGGSGGGHAIPEALIVALEVRFLKENNPKNITLLHPVGVGDNISQGVGHLAHPGLVKRIVTGALVNSPAFQDRAKQDTVEAYILPQGSLSQLMREMAAGRPGLFSQVGLYTFVDPRIDGGKQSKSAKEDLVELVTLEGKEWIFYKPYKVDIAFLRGTTADEDGNVTMEREAVFGEMLSMAQATRRNGGIVIVQVARLAQRGTLPAKQVKIPGMLVDLVVVDPNQRQTYQMEYSPAYAGEIKVPMGEITPLVLDARKIIARRAALELVPGAVCNLGSGVSTGIATVAAEEGILDQIVLTNEQGLIGGAPSSDAGAAINYTSIIDQPYQFDFYDGGGLDLAFLSFAQADSTGNVNVSRFSGRIIGIGGFINISQCAKKVIFSGTFTAGKLEMSWPDGKTVIQHEGKFNKFLSTVEQVSYNGQFAEERGQEALYITERAVFRRGRKGLELIEVAPGIDLDRDVLAHMDFRPEIAKDLKLMDERLFLDKPMGLVADLASNQAVNIPERLQE